MALTNLTEAPPTFQMLPKGKNLSDGGSRKQGSLFGGSRTSLKHRLSKAAVDKSTPRFKKEPDLTDEDEISDCPMESQSVIQVKSRRLKNKKTRASPLLSTYYISHIIHWTLGLFGTVMELLKFPLAAILVLLISGFGMQSALGWAYSGIRHPGPTLATVLCYIPGPSSLDICKPTPTTPIKPNLLFEKGLSYGSKLEEMQRLGANSVELPYYLSIGEGEVRKMVLALGATSIPSRSVNHFKVLCT